MNRCARVLPVKASTAALLFSLGAGLANALAALPAAAQMQRNFPPTALRGNVAFSNPPDILLNGKPARLAPGARIRGLDNMLQMSGSLVNTKFLVNYTLETNGMVFEVWLLTPTEAAVQPWPTTPQQAAQWSFDHAAQTWTAR